MAEVGIIVGRELKKNFRSIKGIILAVLTLLGGGAMGLLEAWINKKRMAEGLTPEMIHDIQAKYLMEDGVGGYGAITGDYVAHAPPALVSIQIMMIWLAPLLVALMGFDAVAGDIQHRSLRFWTVRCRRVSFYFGKVLGLWIVISVLTFAMSFLVWIFCLAMDIASMTDVLSWGLRFWISSLPLTLAWIGLAVGVGSLFRTPILSLLTIFASFFVVWLVGWAIGHYTESNFLRHLYPNFYDRYLLSPKPGQVLAGLAGCLALAGLPSFVGSYVLNRRDV